MVQDEIDAHCRMRACLAGILDLDPAGIGARLVEMDREIARPARRLRRRTSAAAGEGRPAAGRDRDELR